MMYAIVYMVAAATLFAAGMLLRHVWELGARQAAESRYQLVRAELAGWRATKITITVDGRLVISGTLDSLRLSHIMRGGTELLAASADGVEYTARSPLVVQDRSGVYLTLVNLPNQMFDGPLPPLYDGLHDRDFGG